MNQESKKNISKPPYLLGLLGLMPFVGFFVGVALILYGILKYKNKILIIIGIGCMLFSIFAYSAIYYVGFKSDFGKKGWEQHAQMHLNALVKCVEYHKLENGHYPDSIQQLDTRDSFIFITDPTQLGKNICFNYQNLGDKYLLFSSGTDGVPNTEDDIFPKVKPDSQNVGWVKEP